MAKKSSHTRPARPKPGKPTAGWMFEIETGSSRTVYWVGIGKQAAAETRLKASYPEGTIVKRAKLSEEQLEHGGP